MNPIKTLLPTARWLTVTTLLLAALVTQSPAHAQAGIYKWTDEAGEVHYTQTRPPGNTAAERIEGTPPPPDPVTVHKEQQQLQDRIDSMDEHREVQQEEAGLQQEREELAKIDAKNCITAQNNLAKLQQGGVKRYLTPEGEVVRLTDDERQRYINQVNSEIEKYCSH